MNASDVVSIQRRIADATRFVQLVEIDAELEAALTRPGANTALIRYLREEIELRANATVYAAMVRRDTSTAPQGIPGVESPDEPEHDTDGPTLDASEIDPDDDEAVEEFVARAVEASAPRPWSQVESTNATSQDLARDAAFMAIVGTIEAEEQGRFPDTGPELSALLRRLANTGTPDALKEAVSEIFADGAPASLSPSDVERLQAYAQERLQVVIGASQNAALIEFQRQARAMGLSPAELTEIKRLRSQQDLPSVYHAMLEVMHEGQAEMERLHSLPESERPQAAQHMRERLNARLQERIEQKRTAEQLLNELSAPRPPRQGPQR